MSRFIGLYAICFFSIYVVASLYSLVPAGGYGYLAVGAVLALPVAFLIHVLVNQQIRLEELETRLSLMESEDDELQA